jgi:hypothetical protein
MLKRLASHILTGLSYLPALRGASATPADSCGGQSLVEATDPDEQFRLELDAQPFASHHEHAPYTGPVTLLSAQRSIRVTNRRYLNACFDRAHQEYDEFVAERTR